MVKSRKKRAHIIVFSILSVILALVIGFSIYISSLNKKIDFSLIRQGVTSITRIFYFDFTDRKNRIGEAKELESERIYQHKSEWSSFYDMPQNLIDAFVAVEDKRFYEHEGVDWLRTAKAMLNYIFKFDNTSFGGSTITQQLIKNLTGNNETTPKRKIEEVFRAVDLENRLGKNEILEIYLNVVFLSQNCYGVQSASKLYFNKDVSELSLLECASLASIVQNPSKFDPYKHPENNIKRARLVLSLMQEQGYISNEEFEVAVSQNLDVNKNIETVNSKKTYSWYTEAIIDEVTEDLSKEYNISKEEAREQVFSGGLNIYSLIDPGLQEIAEDIFEKNILYINSVSGRFPQSSCVIIDPQTSDVVAIIGGSGKKEGKLLFNRATDAKRPPGSVLKPLSVYAPIINEKIATYATVYDDTPLQLKNGSYWPKNSPNRYRGLVPLYYALEHSINTVAVKALRDLSISKSMAYLDSFNISYDNYRDKNESSLALGQLTNGESLVNLTNAYAAFANNGFVSEPKTYLYVTDSFGNVILENDDSVRQVISNDTASIMTKMMQNVVINGTAKGMNSTNLAEIAGKTGTSSNNEDKWFIGYTKGFVCGVWTGFDTPEPMYYSKNPSVQLFDALFTKIYENSEHISFEENDKLVTQDFCFDSGMLPSDSCNLDLRGQRIVKGYFIRGTEPKEKCNMHIESVIDNETGKIVNKFLPFWRKRRVALVNYSRIKFPFDVQDDNYLLENRKEQ